MVTVKINGLKEVQAQIKSYSASLEKKADAIVERNVREMVRNAKKDAPKDFGRLFGAITAKKNGNADWSMVCDVAYAAYLEFGTKGNYRPIPGVDPSEFKSTGSNKSGKGFYDSILDWVKRKGIAGTYSVKTRKRVGSKIDNQIADEQAAFAIYLSIIRHGIKPQPFFFKQQPIQEPKIQADFIQLVNEQRF
jgi:hypothetical protein